MARNDQDIQITDESLLPDGESLADGDQGGNGEFDNNNLRVNFSEKEASSEARDFTPLPAGKYHVSISDISVAFCGPNSKNPGKPYYSIELTVLDGPFSNRKVFTNCMLFEGALYTLVSIQKALNMPLNGKVPTPDELQGKEFIVSVKNIVNDYKAKQDDWSAADGPKPRKNEVGSFFKYDGSVSVNGQAASSGGAASLMP
jgi:hypothetical protein